jgi:hypothetical protein
MANRMLKIPSRFAYVPTCDVPQGYASVAPLPAASLAEILSSLWNLRCYLFVLDWLIRIMAEKRTVEFIRPQNLQGHRPQNSRNSSLPRPAALCP